MSRQLRKSTKRKQTDINFTPDDSPLTKNTFTLDQFSKNGDVFVSKYNKRDEALLMKDVSKINVMVLANVRGEQEVVHKENDDFSTFLRTFVPSANMRTEDRFPNRVRNPQITECQNVEEYIAKLKDPEPYMRPHMFSNNMMLQSFEIQLLHDLHGNETSILPLTRNFKEQLAFMLSSLSSTRDRSAEIYVIDMCKFEFDVVPTVVGATDWRENML